VAGHPGPVAASISGLPAWGRQVFVGPVLNPRLASSGFLGLWSPPAASAQLTSLATLLPFDVTPPAQHPPLAAASTELRKVTVPPVRSIAPPVGAPSPSMVVCRSETLPPRWMMPPPATAAVLVLNVLLVKVALAELSSPPPDPVSAAFRLSVTALTTSVPATLAIPPPFTAWLLSIHRPVSVALPSLRTPPPPPVVASLSKISLLMDPVDMFNVAVTAL
jgi:hypothetical protein